MLKILGISLCMLVGGLASAQDDSEAYYTITDAKVHVVPTTQENKIFSDFGSIPMAKGPGEIVITLDDLIAFGKAVWPLIKANRPVYEESLSNAISVLPFAEDATATFSKMTNWAAPRSRIYEIVFHNLLGMEVIKFRYMVKFQPGGSFDGKGQYLTDVNVVPISIKVVYGFTFNVKAKLVSISNRGTVANPVAGATLEMTYDTSNLLQILRGTQTIHVAGDGEFVDLNQ